MFQSQELSYQKTAKNAVRDVGLYQLGWYFRNCALSPAAGMLERILLEWLNRVKGKASEGVRLCFESDSDSLYAKDLTRRRRQLREVLRRFSTLPRSNENLELNAFFARDEFGLDKIDTEILLLFLRYERSGDLEQFADEVLHRIRDPARTIAALLGIDSCEVRRRISGESSLVSSGLLSLNDYGGCSGLAGNSGYLQMAPALRKSMHHSYPSRQEWTAAIIGPPLAPSLAWEDFEHLGPVSDLAAQVLVGARPGNTKGINFLLYGPVGTGKTEFAKVLAAHTGRSIWAIGEADEVGDEPTRGERLGSLKLALRLLAKRSNAVILLDEAEDILASDTPLPGFFGGDHNGSKVYVNRLVEENSVPIIWTCNEVSRMDPAILRRMTLAVEMGTPNEVVRARIWQRVLSEQDLELGEDAVRRLSRKYPAPPAVSASAVRVASLSGGGEAAIEEATGSILQLLAIAPTVPSIDSRDFDPALTNCQDDLKRLVEQLANLGTPRQWSLCIHGAPGTGKSQFARYLAARLGMEVMQRRASDLLSMWVGESEKNIAAAFHAARRQRALLVIDEADSLLCNRRGATHSWEVSQVNEMLAWMETHPLPFICTTNLMDRIDEASLRRFTLKLRFEPFDPARAAFAFEHFFGIAAPRRLPDGLTPGDFATVRRKRDLFGVAEPSVLASWLDEEAEAKGIRVLPIGFAAGLGR